MDCLVTEQADINIKDNDGVSEAVVLVLNYSITPDLSFILLHKKRTWYLLLVNTYMTKCVGDLYISTNQPMRPYLLFEQPSSGEVYLQQF